MRNVVVKVGTGLLTTSGGKISERVISKIALEIAQLRKKDFRFAVVSSGAVGCGMIKTGSPKPVSVSQAQFLASVGQPILMNMWVKAFGRRKITAAQILCSADDFSRRNKYLNLRRTLLKILDKGVVPVINENDSVTVDEIKFGDNDRLSALVASHIGAENLVILTNVKGLLAGGKVVPEIREIDRRLLESAAGVSSAFGTGGMKSKLMAAKITQISGCRMTIADGREKNILCRILVEKENAGTTIYPSRKLREKKRWIVFGRICRGAIYVDEGAYKAIFKKGKSLLPAGIVGTEGSFRKGDTVNIIFGKKKFARGIVNYSNAEVEKIRGEKSGDIAFVLGYVDTPEVIHRDNLVLVKE
ncbi:MAG: glutamate 5-kinase [Elusimicrobia bacterium]|nr:glutamate 5-kinase [Elusimicrobiota bacterium]